MTTIRALLLIAAVVPSCGRPSGRDPDRATKPPVVSRLAAILQTECAACHGDGGRGPRLDDTARLSPDGAMHAALLVAAEQMPPRPVKMAPARRSELIRELCEVGAPDPTLCAQSLEPTVDGPLARHPAEFLRALDLAGPPAPRSGEAPSSVTPMVSGYANPDVLILHLEPTWLVLTVLMAAERCSGWVEPADLEACVASALDPSLRSPAPPPSDESNLP